MSQSAETNIQIGQIFVSELSFSHRGQPQQMPTNTPIGELPLALEVSIATDGDGKKAFVVLRVMTRDDEDPIYRFSVTMMGIIWMTGEQTLDDDPFKRYLYQGAPATMYPFMRECIANLTSRGRFGPVWVKPMNFEIIGEKLLQQQQQNEAAKGQVTTTSID
jgi:protein-export chaperone SecB